MQTAQETTWLALVEILESFGSGVVARIYGRSDQ